MNNAALEEAWRNLDETICEVRTPFKLPSDNQQTDLYEPVTIEFFGEKKRLAYSAERKLPPGSIHVRATAAEEVTLDDPDLIDDPSAAETLDLGPARSAR